MSSRPEPLFALTQLAAGVRGNISAEVWQELQVTAGCHSGHLQGEVKVMILPTKGNAILIQFLRHYKAHVLKFKGICRNKSKFIHEISSLKTALVAWNYQESCWYSKRQLHTL